MKTKYEIHDLLRYFHNARRPDGTLAPILGEDEVALTAALAYLLEDNNFCIKAYSGTGMTVIMDAIKALLPPEWCYTMEHLSDTAVWYDKTAINLARFIFIPEAQKLPEGCMEIIKTWADERTANRKVTDVTTKRTRAQYLFRKYVFMCVAVENDKGSAYFDAELERRCMIMHTNPTVTQTERVLKYKLSSAALPKTKVAKMSVEEIEGLAEHIKNIITERDDDRSTIIKNPCAPFLIDAIPSAFPVSRSKIQYLLRLINAVARFHPEELIRVEQDGVQYGLVSPKHNWIGLRIYLNSFVEECLHMPSHGTDILKLFHESRLDRFGVADSDTVKMSETELKKAAKAAGLPFTKLRPVISGLLMTGFLESEEDGKRILYYKSPLLTSPQSKIKWNDLIEETKNFIRENWPEVAEEYIGRSCSRIHIVDPISGDNIELGARAKRATEVERADYPDLFKSAKDAKIKDYESFLTKAEGDYNEKEFEAIRSHFQKS